MFLRTLGIFLTSLLGATVSSLLLLPLALFDDEGGFVAFDHQDDIDTLLGIIVIGVFFGSVTGLIVSAGRWRILGGGVTGSLVYLVAGMLVTLSAFVFEEPLEGTSAEIIAEMLMAISIMIALGIITGLVCGALSPRRKKADLQTEPPPPDHFNFG